MAKLFLLMEDYIPKSNSNIAIIGCGIFGALSALELARKGNKVTIFEAHKKILSGATLNNQNRLHLGYHYPRSDETAQQCLKSFDSFKSKFSSSITGEFNNAYFISKHKSKISPDNYLKFCDRNGLKYKLFDTKKFKPTVDKVSLGILSQEVVYDCQILRSLIIKKLDDLNIQVLSNCKIEEVKLKKNKYELFTKNKIFSNFEVLVNSSYSDINRITGQLGFTVSKQQYEYTIIPIIKWDIDTVGVTILDGEFMTLLPYGKTNNFLLYHVSNSVYDTKIQDYLPTEWQTDKVKLIKEKERKFIFKKMIKECSYFLPEIKSSSYLGSLQGSRMVLKNQEIDDKRPSSLTDYGSNYYTIYSGKIDHAIEVSEKLGKLF